MTVQETKNAFGQFIDEFTTARVQNVNFWINEGIEAFVKMRLTPEMEAATKSGFQVNQRVRDDLANIIKLDFTGTYADGIITRPEDCYELLPHSIRLGDVASSDTYVINARARTWGWFNANIKNAFTKPQFLEGRLIYIEDKTGFRIYPIRPYLYVRLSYVEIWAPFSDDQVIVLHQKTHTEIVRLAAAKYLTSVNNYVAAKNLLSQNAIE